uniref:Uncharacterized protein n=1 Tax=Bionectria ochroleuca TaxID=29856 RepID=A0A8H7N222_BIOOC
MHKEQDEEEKRQQRHCKMTDGSTTHSSTMTTPRQTFMKSSSPSFPIGELTARHKSVKGERNQADGLQGLLMCEFAWRQVVCPCPQGRVYCSQICYGVIEWGGRDYHVIPHAEPLLRNRDMRVPSSCGVFGGGVSTSVTRPRWGWGGWTALSRRPTSTFGIRCQSSLLIGATNVGSSA